MKKYIFLISLLVVGLSFVFPHKSLAASTFSCKWNGSGCILDAAKSQCSDNFHCGNLTHFQCITPFAKNVACSVANPTSNLSPNTPVQITSLSGATGLDSSLDNIGSIISLAVKFLFPIAGIILLFYLIAGGFQIMLSGGDPKAAESGKKKITNAIIGFVIIFVAFWLVVIISKIFGISVISTIFT